MAKSYTSHFLAGHNAVTDARRKQDRAVPSSRRVRFVTNTVGLTAYTKLCDEKATSAEHASVRKSELELTNIQVVLIRQRF